MRFFRSAAIFLLLGSLRPAAAVDLTNYVPFVADVPCIVKGTFCEGSVVLPNRQIVLDYMSFDCSGGDRLVGLNVFTQVGGVDSSNFLELPVAASLGVTFGATSGGQVVRIYADPNSRIAVEAIMNSPNSSIS